MTRKESEVSFKMSEPSQQHEQFSMQHRQIKLDDGRYMIFYTFDDPSSEHPGLDLADDDPVTDAAPPANAGGSDLAAKDTDV